MSSVLSELLDLLTLEQIEQGLYRGKSQDLGFGRVFGGQVIGQALAAAKQTLEPQRGVHSFHSYFLRPGDSLKPIVYDVESIRDGRSISTRRIKAIQFGKPIFFMTASFHQGGEGYDHQIDGPAVPGPEGLMSKTEIARKHTQQIPEKLRSKFTCDKPIEVRPVTFFNPIHPQKTKPECQLWIKTSGPLPEDLRVHQYLLAYASDFSFLPVATQPHGVSYLTPGFQMATIDHSMWFHRPFRFDQWLIYVIESPSASDERGFVTGRFYDQTGRLVASTAQEGVIRYKK